jgi:hypothetical protein
LYRAKFDAKSALDWYWRHARSPFITITLLFASFSVHKDCQVLVGV